MLALNTWVWIVHKPLSKLIHYRNLKIYFGIPVQVQRVFELRLNNLQLVSLNLEITVPDVKFYSWTPLYN